MSTADVIVIGAGIVGAACAYELARAGLGVQVLDARVGGATAAGMGHLVVMDDNPAELALSQASLDIWHTWGPRMAADQPGCQFTTCGTLWVAANAEEMAAAEEKLQRLRAHGIACELLGATALAQCEPLLRPGLAGALKVVQDSIVYAPSAAEWLLQHARRPIAVQQAEVLRIAGRSVHLADGRTLSAGAVLLAAGIQAPRLCPGLPIRAKKGHLAITERYPGVLRHQLVELGYISSAHHSDGSSVAFNLQPRPTGQLLIGSSRQFDSTDAQVDNAMLARMLRRALTYAPGLAELNILRTWTGLRAATPDSLPLIGPHPGHDGLWLAAGHEGLGVTTAPATAQLVAALLTGGSPAIDPAPYAPGRFALGGNV